MLSLDEQYYRDGHLYVDLRQQLVMLDGEMVRLTPMQYRLLALLVEHAGVVVTRPVFLIQLGGYSPEIRERRVDACIHGLRRKLGVYADQSSKRFSELDTFSDPCQELRARGAFSQCRHLRGLPSRIDPLLSECW